MFSIVNRNRNIPIPFHRMGNGGLESVTHGSRNWTERIFLTMETVVKLIKATDIVPRKIQWIWKDRIPLGKLTLFVGDPDNGKSMVATEVAATVTTGRHWFDAENTFPPSDVLFFACEDDYEDTAVPRLMAAGAKLNKIHFGEMREAKAGETEKQREMRLDTDIEAIAAALDENPRIRLVVIDPVSNHLGNKKMVDEQAMRAILRPLHGLARKKSIAILGIMHLNKKVDLKLINRVGGAMAFVGVARAVWVFNRDNNKENTFAMLPLKNNISERCGGLEFRIETKPIAMENESVEQPYIKWVDKTDRSIDSLLQSPKPGRPGTEREAAAEWVVAFLAEGPKAATEVERECELAGHSFRTLERTKDECGVESFKGDAQWFWRLKPTEVDASDVAGIPAQRFILAVGKK